MKRTIANLYSIHSGNVSDKWHSYLLAYDFWFDRYKDLPVNLLEIGVQNGGSLEIWAKYFLNAKRITGCDLNSQCSKIIFDDSRIEIIVGDINAISTRQMIATPDSNFDIIIDDGSHKSRDIIKTFKYFYPLLSPGGIYVIEDLHCSYWAQWGGGLLRINSAMEFFKGLTDMLNFECWDSLFQSLNHRSRIKKLSKMYSLYFGFGCRDVSSISFHSSMCVIVKGQCNATVGGRVIAGNTAVVSSNFPKPGSSLPVPFQKNIT